MVGLGAVRFSVHTRGVAQICDMTPAQCGPVCHVSPGWLTKPPALVGRPSGCLDPIDDGREPRAFRSITHLHNAVLEVVKHAVHFPLRGAFSNDGVG